MKTSDVPQTFRERMRAQLGDEADDFFRSLEETSPVSIRMHPLKGQYDEELTDRVPWCEEGYYLDKRPFFHMDPHWHSGAYYVQEASSMILDHVIRSLSLQQKPRVWVDLCAAPGGKTGILAKFMEKGDVMIANEVVPQRRSVLYENLVKGGYPNIFITGESAESFNAPLADIMLIDAPCAGEGMMRKEPEAIHQWSPSLVKDCSLMQKKIVFDAIHAIKPGGYLIYSTCSYSHSENIDNVSAFAETANLSIVEIPFPDHWNIKEITSPNAVGYQLYPHRVKGEGLFISVLVNEKEETRPRSGKVMNHFENLPNEWDGRIHLSGEWKLRKKKVGNELIHIDAVDTANEVLRHFPRAQLTNDAGVQKGKDFIPSHFLAMSGIQHEDYQKLNLEKNISLDYLEREVRSLPMKEAPGWYLATYHSTVLGWVKNSQNGWKNHYPIQWRLRSRQV